MTWLIYLLSVYILLSSSYFTYHYYILWPISSHSYFPYSRHHKWRDWNIQSSHNPWLHPRLRYYWNSPLKLPRDPRVLLPWSSLCIWHNQPLEQFFVIISAGNYSLLMYLMSIHFSSTIYLKPWWRISIFLVQIPTCLLFDKKRAPWFSLLTTTGFCNSVISSTYMLANFTSCEHADSAT